MVDSITGHSTAIDYSLSLATDKKNASGVPEVKPYQKKFSDETSTKEDEYETE